ncbi:MAG: hypothetical protein ABIB55_00280 [Candidatus Nealsonbacteria bacterium]
MAIEFLQAQKKQRYLILILTLAICATLLVVWIGFFKTPAVVAPVFLPQAVQPKIGINWDVLKDTKLEALQNFEQTPALEDEVGRENPFTPY